MAAHKKTHCSRGHPRTPENLTPSRNCRICCNARRKTYRSGAPDRYRGYSAKAAQELTAGYLNKLIRAKTGLPTPEITEADRELWRERITDRRAKRSGK